MGTFLWPLNMSKGFDAWAAHLRSTQMWEPLQGIFNLQDIAQEITLVILHSYYSLQC